MRGQDNQRQYPKKLKLLFDFLGLPGSSSLEEQGQIFLQKARENQYWAQDSIMSYLNYQKQRFYSKEIAAGTLANHIGPIKMFCEMHDLANINWKRISKSLPPARKSSKDRVPTIEEIRKIVEYPDRRAKPIVYVMCSSGIRVGAWDYLKWKHVIAIPDKENTGNEIVAAKLIVYAGEPEEYYTFITPEAYHALQEWMDFRASYGEKITPESWLMRNMWKTADVPRGAGGTNGLATCPKRLTSKGVAKILIRALLEQGIRANLPPDVKRHEWKGAHGFRKFFETHASQAMNFINVELLMGHSLGLSDSYYKPAEKDVLADYVKSIDTLTINKEQKIVAKMQGEIMDKLAEKDKQIDLLQEEYARMNEIVLRTARVTDSMIEMFRGATTKNSSSSSNIKNKRRRRNKNGQVTNNNRKYTQFVSDTLSLMKVSSGLSEQDFDKIWSEALKGNRKEMEQKLMQARRSKSVTKGSDKKMLIVMENLTNGLQRVASSSS